MGQSFCASIATVNACPMFSGLAWSFHKDSLLIDIQPIMTKNIIPLHFYQLNCFDSAVYGLYDPTVYGTHINPVAAFFFSRLTSQFRCHHMWHVLCESLALDCYVTEVDQKIRRSPRWPFGFRTNQNNWQQKRIENKMLRSPWGRRWRRRKVCEACLWRNILLWFIGCNQWRKFTVIFIFGNLPR